MFDINLKVGDVVTLNEALVALGYPTHGTIEMVSPAETFGFYVRFADGTLRKFAHGAFVLPLKADAGDVTLTDDTAADYVRERLATYEGVKRVRIRHVDDAEMDGQPARIVTALVDNEDGTSSDWTWTVWIDGDHLYGEW
jgi:hypothetical protein